MDHILGAVWGAIAMGWYHCAWIVRDTRKIKQRRKESHAEHEKAMADIQEAIGVTNENKKGLAKLIRDMEHAMELPDRTLH